MRFKLTILFLLLGLFSNLYNVKADYSTNSIDIEFEKINPDSILYPAKRLVEKIKLKLFARSEEQKENYYINLLDTRFKELAYVADNDLQDEFETSSSRYNTTVGMILDNYQLSSDLNSKYEDYIKVFTKLRNDYKTGSFQWLYLQQATDITEQLMSN